MQPNQISDTAEPNKIRDWAEQRNGKPALLKQKNDTGRAGEMLKIVFPGDEAEDFDLISWEQFFIIFEENNLKFLFVDEEEKQFYRMANRND